jgi:hypothetical protein
MLFALQHAAQALKHVTVLQNENAMIEFFVADSHHGKQAASMRLHV